MLIEPNTTVKLIRNCPLDNTYKNTYYFPEPTEQETFFKALSSITLSKQYYQRYARGVITLKLSADDIYDVNYMMFQNESYITKWFYAFVNRVEYVSNNACRIYYSVDVIQTWMFDYDAHMCFVEREHTDSDNIGEHILAENLPVGETLYGNYGRPTKHIGEEVLDMTELAVVVMYRELGDLDLVEIAAQFDVINSGVYYGAYQGVNFLILRIKNAQDARSLDYLFNNIDFVTQGGFIGAFMMPLMFEPYAENENQPFSPQYDYGFSVSMPNNIDGYLPKNNKMYTYPYCYSALTNGQGQIINFPYEYFNSKDGTARFSCACNFQSGSQAIAFPIEYKGFAKMTNACVSIGPYPICTWANDKISEWFNNNSLKLLAYAVAPEFAPTAIYSMTQGVAPSYEWYASKPVLGQRAGYLPSPSNSIAVASQNLPVSNVTYNWARSEDGYEEGFEIGLNQTGANVLNAISRSMFNGVPYNSGTARSAAHFAVRDSLEFRVYDAHITRAYAESIDDYFTKFGYLVNKIKYPSFNNRRRYTYIKTAGFGAVGRNDGVPAEDLQKICAIHDSGITYWKTNSRIGDYSYTDNTPNRQISG